MLNITAAESESPHFTVIPMVCQGLTVNMALSQAAPPFHHETDKGIKLDNSYTTPGFSDT